MKSSQIREVFLEFFKKKNHQIVDSAPLVIKGDPTLMFTNAGMNQFKDVFLGNDEAISKRVADTQKCLRVSGKHNDLEEVGVDTYHHTMFEMLGNWSFGNYYKKEAIEWAWELLTEVYKIEKDRIYVTIFEGDLTDGLELDQEAFGYWKNLVSEDRILMGSKKDNFWEMGDMGPCGPCSEIHVDLRPLEERMKTPGENLVNADHPQVVELWNLVFMELNRQADGSLTPLKEKHIDTGMGFERLAMVLQGKLSNYDTDVFTPLISSIEEITGIEYQRSNSKVDIAFRVLVDHVRAVAFAIADGQMPSNTGAGYVIRRILRRAVRYAYSFLERREPILALLAEKLESQLGDFFVELTHSKGLIVEVIREEEEAFLRTLAKGIERINEIISKTEGNQVDGETVFELYDTYGFPQDLTALILSEYEKTYDEMAFKKALERQKSRSRKDSQVSTADWTVLADSPSTDFVGYDVLESDVQLVRYREVDHKGKKLFHLVFDRTPFYPEGGGQVGDKGYIETDGKRLSIEDTYRENNLIVHVTKSSPKGLGSHFQANVAGERRLDTQKNHSVTHLLHQALRMVLGTHVEQKGSLVQNDHLRFDFSHFSKMSDEEIREVENFVNERIRENLPLEEFRRIPLQAAKEMGAIALFGEKYGDDVRVIKFGDSKELCGGTHVKATGEIGFFRILNEGSVAAGVRRIEAVTGRASQDKIFEDIDELSRVKSLLKIPKGAPFAVESLLTKYADLEKEIVQLKLAKTKNLKAELIDKVKDINGINFLAEQVDLDPASIKDLSFQLRKELSPLFIVLATVQNKKATISVALSDDLVSERNLNSSHIVKRLSEFIQGGGGGQPFFATAGGKNVEGIPGALKCAEEVLSVS
ncbi:MAG: alanine--tRNA ligase [Flavobacteriales bacterium]|nr:alanine--tRNA ligase [Flavobacteriales bacterium]